jgi:hypothetical protein
MSETSAPPSVTVFQFRQFFNKIIIPEMRCRLLYGHISQLPEAVFEMELSYKYLSDMFQFTSFNLSV